MEQGAQTLWPDWNTVPSTVRAVPAAVVAVADEDVETYLRAALAALEADQAFLTLRCDDGAETFVEIASVGGALSLKAREQVATLATPRMSADNSWPTLAAEPEWSSCMLDQRSWHVLRLPVWSRRAGTSVVLQLLFKTASLADRSRTLLKLQALRPLIEPYLRLWQRMRVQARASVSLKGALDALEMGILLVDRSSRIIFANAAANRIMSDGEPLRRLGESFTASDVRQAVSLQVAMSHAIAINAEASDDPAPSWRASMLELKSLRLGRSLVVSVAPAETRATEKADVSAVVYIADPKRDLTKQLRPACALFGLSPVEGRLACLLATGRTLQDAAKAMRVKDQTARSYLKQVFLKTGTARQADLVRVMLCSLVRIEHENEPQLIKSGV